ncbi:hypothetical protein ACJJTC_019717 [Scirpophaga incertulas]
MTISQQEGPADYESSEVAPRGGRDVTTVNRSHRGGGHDAARRGTPRVFFLFLLKRVVFSMAESQISPFRCLARTSNLLKDLNRLQLADHTAGDRRMKRVDRTYTKIISST